MRRARKVKATIPSAGETLDVTWRIPLLKQEGWTRRQTLERRGRGGHSGRTTPSALSKVASQLFLDAQPLPVTSLSLVKFQARSERGRPTGRCRERICRRAGSGTNQGRLQDEREAAAPWWRFRGKRVAAFP